MHIPATRLLPVLLAGSVLWTPAAGADSTDARCDIYPRGEDKASAMIPCVFSQRQGYVTIDRADGVYHDLSPNADNPAVYRTADGSEATREMGLGEAGLIFRFATESVYVYWSTAALEPVQEGDKTTAPYTTADYDATTLLRCGAVDAETLGTCPAGILRMDGGQASIVITGPSGAEFTVNFMTDYVNSAAGDIDASLDGDTWKVILNGQERYEVPVAAIEGG